jgi:hypothetical protein
MHSMVAFRPPLPDRLLPVQSSSMKLAKVLVVVGGTVQKFPRASPKRAKHDVPGDTFMVRDSAKTPKSEREFAGTMHWSTRALIVLLTIELPVRVNPSPTQVPAGNDKEKTKQPETQALARGAENTRAAAIARRDSVFMGNRLLLSKESTRVSTRFSTTASITLMR